MTFGPHGFFGYSPCAPLSPISASSPENRSLEGDNGKIMWWSTYEVDPPPSRNPLLTDIRSQLMERHGFWMSPHDSDGNRVFSSIIQLACGSVSSTTATISDKPILILPSYTTPHLPRWCTTSGKVFLLGDACHTMPPHSGQGVSCAIEDSLAIALLLGHFLSQRPTSTTTGELDLSDVLRNSAKAYEDIRKSRVESIVDRARKIGDFKRKQGKVQEWIRDWIMWVMCKLPESMMHDGLYGYNVGTEVEKYLGKII